MERPIPPFYCVYLLRSTVRHASLYIGSTPNPRRRLNQHNGNTIGGAKRTQRSTLRPWEMAVIVTGFTSKIAALQFEWAWQNTHVTRHISREERITPMGAAYKTTDRRGRVSTKHRRPILSARDRLLNLHLLLNSQSFHRWPLSVRFFAKDVYANWLKWTAASQRRLRGHIAVSLDAPQSAGDRSVERGSTTCADEGGTQTANGIDAIDIGYGSIKPYLQKSLAAQSMLHNEPGVCKICQQSIVHNQDFFVVCPGHSCDMLSHITCLSQRFLRAESRDRDGTLVPTHGDCPCCATRIIWADAAQDASLRFRGQAQITTILKKVNGSKPQQKSSGDLATAVVEQLNDDFVDIDDVDAEAEELAEDETKTPELPAKKQRKQRKSSVVAKPSMAVAEKVRSESAMTAKHNKLDPATVINDSEDERDDAAVR